MMPLRPLQKLGVGQKVLLTFGTLGAILLGVGALFFFSLRAIERRNGVQQKDALTCLAMIDDTAQDIGQIQAKVLQEVLASAPADIEAQEAAVYADEQVNVQELIAYQKYIVSAEGKRLYARVMQAQAAYWVETGPVLAFGRDNWDAEAIRLINTRQARAYDELFRAVKDLTINVEAEANATAEATSHFIAKIRVIGNFLIGVAVLIVLGAGLAVAEVTRQLKADNSRLEADLTERKRVAEELNWKTAFLEAQVHSSIDGILVVDDQGKKTLQNARMLELLRIPAEIAADPDDRPQLQWVTEQIKDPERFVAKVVYLNTHRLEVSRDEIELKDGLILDRYSAPLVGRDGKYYGRIWTFRDITQSKRTEESLRLLGSAVEQSREAITITDADLDLPGPKIVFVNAAFTKMTGYTAAQAVGHTPRILQGPRTDRSVLDRLRANLEKGEVFEGEAINYRQDGSEFTLEWQVAPIRNAHGVITHFGAIQHDITERNQMTANRDRLAAILEMTTDLVSIADPAGHLTYLNRAGRDLLGTDRDEDITPTTIASFLPNPATHPIVTIGIPAAVRDGTWTGEAVLRSRSGREFSVSLVLLAHWSADGTLESLSTIMRDMTDRKRLEERLIQSQKMETMGKLTGGIAHEFNSILTAIIGQSELLLADLPPGGPQAKSATEISKAAGRAATLTRQLLAYGRRQILQPEVLDLNRVISGMHDMFHHLMGGVVTTEFLPAAGLHAVRADAGQIEQVIMNLAINARDAMPNGGKFILETANITFDQESVGRYSELKPGDYVMLAVTDTGIGMNAAVKARLFEPFFSTKGVGKGTGLGLSTCYGIVKQSGGHISAYSEEGRGTTFKIYLPKIEAEVKQPAARLNSPNLPRGTETVMVVEDDPALREMVTTLLERLGYTVFAAGNGVEALNLRQQHGIGYIDLLFTDVVMPHMSGKELAARVQALFPYTRILFTSAYTEQAIVHQGVLNKGVALLQKPFTPAALAHKLREILDRPEALAPEVPQLAPGASL
jgi:PAS domain S-box-containing protein